MKNLSTKSTKPILTLAAAGALALSLAACSNGGGTAQPSASASASAAPSASASAASPAASPSASVNESKPHHHAPIESVSATFAPAEKGGKTYVLGTLKNTGTTAITIKSASSKYAGTVELHKTAADGTMSVDTEGWTIEPGKTLELKDDGFHIAVKDLKAGMKKGDSLEITLTTTDGPAHLDLVAGEAAAGGHHH